MEIIESKYNELMDLIDEAKEAELDHISTSEHLAPELLDLLTQKGFKYEPIERDNEIKGYKISWH